MENYYSVLEVNEDASLEEIKEAYRALVKMCHPDHNAGNKFAAEKFKRIQTAYEVLSDPQKRSQYDAQLRKSRKSQWEHQSHYNNYEAEQEPMYRQTYTPQPKKKNIGEGILAGAAVAAGIASIVLNVAAENEAYRGEALSAMAREMRSETPNMFSAANEIAAARHAAVGRTKSKLAKGIAGVAAGILGGIAVSKHSKNK